MAQSRSFSRIEVDSSAFIVVRTVASLFLLATYAVWAPGAGPVQRRSFIAGALAWVLCTAVVAIVHAARRHIDLRLMLRVVLLPDCVALGLLTAATARLGDPMFVWVALEAMLYSAVFARSRAWLLSGCFVAASVFGQVASLRSLGTVEEALFLAMETAGVLGIGWFVGVVVQRHAERAKVAEERRANVVALNEQLRHNLEKLELVSRIGEVVHATLDLDTVAPTVLETLRAAVDIPPGCLYVVDKEKGEILFRASDGLAGGPPAPPGRVDLVSDGVETPEGHFACTELLDRDQLLVLFCAGSDAMAALPEEDRDVLRSVASELVMAVENSQLYQIAKRLSITDDLTGLRNYRYLQSRLIDEVGRARRYRKQLALLMVDVDGLRALNEVYGHAAADDVLVDVGRTIAGSVRQIDEVARYAGGEFAVLLPETDASAAFIVAEKIREAVAVHRFADIEGDRPVSVTVSVGIASVPLHADDVETLLRAGDEALQLAKASGRDRVRAPRIGLERLGGPAVEGASR